MQSKDIHGILVARGWNEAYLNKPLDRYYRYQVETVSGLEYFYLERKGPYSRLCLHPRFSDWRTDFRNCNGVKVGQERGDLKGKSDDMLAFPKVKGSTGNDIPEFFPLRFLTPRALTEALAVIAHRADFLPTPPQQGTEVADPGEPNAISGEMAESKPCISVPPIEVEDLVSDLPETSAVSLTHGQSYPTGEPDPCVDESVDSSSYMSDAEKKFVVDFGLVWKHKK